MPEHITTSTPEDSDWWICLCGNDAISDGFSPCHADGTITEPDTGKWDGQHQVCYRCGRVIREGTGEVVARTEVPQ